MCTIGNSFYDYNGRTINSIFKQCDLVSEPIFLTPEVETNTICEDGKEILIRYVAMKRKKPDSSEPAWAGVNDYGVAFVAADSYLDSNSNQEPANKSKEGISVFDMYLDTIKLCTTAKQAADMACKFYSEDFFEADIFMVGDATSSYFIEAFDKKVSCIERKENFFASTNHFRMIYGAAPYSQNHSTYFRLNRAEQILQSKSDLDGIGDVLRDGYYGKTVWSICRYADNSGAPEEELYYTQAAVIFNVIPNSDASKKPVVILEYVINGNASAEGKGFSYRPFSTNANIPTHVPYIGKLTNLSTLIPVINSFTATRYYFQSTKESSLSENGFMDDSEINQADSVALIMKPYAADFDDYPYILLEWDTSYTEYVTISGSDNTYKPTGSLHLDESMAGKPITLTAWSSCGYCVTRTIPV